MRTIVVADLHGSLRLLENCLAHSGYRSGRDELVVAGDVCDIGRETVECLSLIEEQGGIVLAGNHEVAHCLGRRIFGFDPGLTAAEMPRWAQKIMAGEWTLAYQADEVCVSHAGIAPRIVEEYRLEGKSQDVSLAEWLNAEFCRSLEWTAAGNPELGLRVREDPHGLHASDGPLWFRPQPHRPPAEIVQVAGHTPDYHYAAEYLEALRARGFFLIDPFAIPPAGRHDHCRYAVITSGSVAVVDIRTQT